MTRATNDTLFGGQVSLAQPARGEGYRVNVDALLLAAFARKGPRARAAFDLGAGAGGVALALLHWNAIEKVTLIEIDPDAAALARQNLETNNWALRGQVLVGDVTAVARSRPGGASLVVCNPPYFALGRGRVANVPARGRARSGELALFVEAARALLGRRARACFIYPARELASLTESLRTHRLEPKRMRFVRATASDAARVVMVEAMVAKPGGLVIEPDLIERDGAGLGEELSHIVAG